MPRPQNSPRGLFSKKQITVVPNSGTPTDITANSTGLLLSAGLAVSGQSGQKLTANSTAIILSAARIGTLASYITANSTGIKIGTRYISTNTTGNATT